MVNKGRETWLKSKENQESKSDGSEFGHRGGRFGYLGKPQESYTEEDLKEIGEQLIDWVVKNKDAIYIKEFFVFKGMLTTHVNYLKAKYPVFAEYYHHAKDMLETRWVKYPFFKKADGNHARFVMGRHFDDFKGAGLEEMPDNILDKHEQMIKEIKAARQSKKDQEAYPDV